MSASEILKLVGLTSEQVAAAANKHRAPSESVAERNERKYKSVQTEGEWFERKHRGGVYAEIACGTDNGTCTTRAGTYRRIKTGDGRRI